MKNDDEELRWPPSIFSILLWCVIVTSFGVFGLLSEWPEAVGLVAMACVFLFATAKVWVKRGKRIQERHDSNPHPWQPWAEDNDCTIHTDRLGKTTIRGNIDGRAVTISMGGWLPGMGEVLFVLVQLDPRMPRMKPMFFREEAPTLRMQAMVNNEAVKTQRAALGSTQTQIKDGQLVLYWPRSSRSSLERIKGTIQLAQHLEDADGASWRSLAQRNGLQWSSQATGWQLHGTQGGLSFSATYTSGQTEQTTVTAAPADSKQWPESLSIQAKEAGAASMNTGNPVLDAMVSITWDAGASLPAALSDPEHTGSILSVIKGRGGQVCDGAVRITVPELVLDIEPLFEDATELARALLQD